MAAKSLEASSAIGRCIESGSSHRKVAAGVTDQNILGNLPLFRSKQFYRSAGACNLRIAANDCPVGSSADHLILRKRIFGDDAYTHFEVSGVGRGPCHHGSVNHRIPFRTASNSDLPAVTFMYLWPFAGVKLTIHVTPNSVAKRSSEPLGDDWIIVIERLSVSLPMRHLV